MGSDHHFVERRLSPRGILRAAGVVQRASDEPTFPCVVVDISNSGANISAPNVALPTHFLLTLSSRGSVKHRCEVIWREGFTTGVQFMPGPHEVRNSKIKSIS